MKDFVALHNIVHFSDGVLSMHVERSYVAGYDLGSIVIGAAGAVVLWILGYISKHWLDRNVLPKILDRWSALSSRRAVNRAEKLAIEHRIEKSINLSERISRKITISIQLIFLTFPVIVMLQFATIAVIFKENIVSNNDFIFVLLVMIGTIILSVLFNCALLMKAHNIDRKNYFKSYEMYLVRRIVRLLVAAGRKDEEVEAWLKQYPVSYDVYCLMKERNMIS